MTTTVTPPTTTTCPPDDTPAVEPAPRPAPWEPISLDRVAEIAETATETGPEPPGSAAAQIDAQITLADTSLASATLLAPRVEPDWVLPGLPAGDVGMLVAPGGTGKTRLGLQVAVGVATGSTWPWMTTYGAGRVLYLAGEERTEVLIDRMRVIAQSEPMSAEACDRLNEAMTLVSMVPLPGAVVAGAGGEQGPLAEALIARAERGERYRLIVLDPLACFGGGDEASNSSTTRMVQHLRAVAAATGAAVLLIHHASQAATVLGQLDQAEAARGVTALSAGVRWQTALMRLSDDQADAVDRAHGADAHKRFRRMIVTKSNHLPDGTEEVWLEMRAGGYFVALPHSEVERYAATRPAPTDRRKRS